MTAQKDDTVGQGGASAGVDGVFHTGKIYHISLKLVLKRHDFFTFKHKTAVLSLIARTYLCVVLGAAHHVWLMEGWLV